MPAGERVRYTLSAVIPRNDWRESLTQRSFVEWTYQETCTTIDGLSPIAVAREGYAIEPANLRNDRRRVTTIEIILAKIISLRYIAFARLIRFFDVWTASAFENISKPRNSFCFWICVLRVWANRHYSSAFTHAGK